MFGPASVPLAVRDAQGRVRAAGRLDNAALASSIIGHSTADRERFPACLIAPDAAQGGRHAVNNEDCPAVWSVQARHCWKADALTKVAALAAPAERAQRIARLGGRLLTPFGADALRPAA